MQSEIFQDGHVEHFFFSEKKAEFHFANAVRKPGIREIRVHPRVGRNDDCPCGSGRKFKKCHLGVQIPGRVA